MTTRVQSNPSERSAISNIPGTLYTGFTVGPVCAVAVWWKPSILVDQVGVGSGCLVDPAGG